MSPPPIVFTAVRTMALPAAAIEADIADVGRWPSFRGYGPIPGVKAAEYRRRAESLLGSEIAVTNLDGSRHVETVVAHDPGRSLTLEMREFSPPLAHLAERFVERWRFAPDGERTRVERSFELHARGLLGRAVLPLIAPLLRRAVERHLREMDPGP